MVKKLIALHGSSAVHDVTVKDGYVSVSLSMSQLEYQFSSSCIHVYNYCLDNELCGASLIAQLVKNLPAMQETPVQFLGWEGPLEKE